MARTEMTDRELDQVLAAAVNADHSPEFLAKVRLTVEQHDGFPLRGRRSRAVGVAFASMAVTVVSAAVWWSGHVSSDRPAGPSMAVERGVEPRDRATVIAAEVAVPERTPTLGARAAESSIGGRSARLASRASVRVPAQLPRSNPFGQIVISPDDAAMVGVLSQNAAAGLAPTSFLEGPVSVPTLETTIVGVQPLEPIASLEIGELP